jgi:hypothetical protein
VESPKPPLSRSLITGLSGEELVATTPADYGKANKLTLTPESGRCEQLFSEVFDLKSNSELYAQSGLKKLGHLSFLRNNERVSALRPEGAGGPSPGVLTPGRTPPEKRVALKGPQIKGK